MDEVTTEIPEDPMVIPTILSVLLSDNESDSRLVFANVTSRFRRKQVWRLPDDAVLMISLYSAIFLLCIVGNSLVILTLAQNRRMRSVTNAFLLNLAISDLLLGVFCMPFTLIGSLLRNFIFGEVVCRLINYFQGVSVSVGVWTLVSISLERYFAICRPLHSRQWQTISHAYKVIFLIWSGSLITMLPSAILSQLLPTRARGKYKCREVWPDIHSERGFMIYLDAALLVGPLIIMAATYSLIAKKLCTGGRMEVFSPYRNKGLQEAEMRMEKTQFNSVPSLENGRQSRPDLLVDQTLFQANCQQTARGTYEKQQTAKSRVVRMLFVVVVEFFVCWTPLYVVNTWVLYDAKTVYTGLGYAGLSTIHLMAYISSCCNPVTYCFMHKKYRQGFLAAVGCKRRRRRMPSDQRAEYSGTLVSIFSTKGGSVRSETMQRVTTSGSERPCKVRFQMQ